MLTTCAIGSSVRTTLVLPTLLIRTADLAPLRYSFGKFGSHYIKRELFFDV